MEEFIYEYLVTHRDRIETAWVYVPVYWTNLQNHPAFSSMRARYQTALRQALQGYPAGTPFFTCVQHDDGPQLTLPTGTIVFGACSGDRILPLIYEDTAQRLASVPRRPWSEKDMIASFVGTMGTHPLRSAMYQAMKGEKGVVFHSRAAWSVAVKDGDAAQFIEVTGRSRFCLAPRGYGRSSFRFFEALLMDVVPVYVWDDAEWLPYKDELDYSRFSVSVSVEELPSLYERLAGMTEEEYEKMVEEIRRVRSYFTMEGMCSWLERQMVCGV